MTNCPFTDERPSDGQVVDKSNEILRSLTELNTMAEMTHIFAEKSGSFKDFFKSFDASKCSPQILQKLALLNKVSGGLLSDDESKFLGNTYENNQIDRISSSEVFISGSSAFNIYEDQTI